MDIMPTLFDLLDLPKPKRLRGTSMYDGLCGKSLPHELAMGRTFDPSPFVAPMTDMRLQLSYLVKGNEKIILDHLTGGIEVYDLASDPSEANNLYTANPSRDHLLLGLLDQWLYDMNSFGEYLKVQPTNNRPIEPVPAAPGDTFVLPIDGNDNVTYEGFYDVDRRVSDGETIVGRWTKGHGTIRLRDRRFATTKDCTLKANVAGGDYELVFNGSPIPSNGSGTHHLPLGLVANRLEHQLELISETTLRGEHQRPFGAMLKGLSIQCPPQ
jgi:hypothetical protein